MLNQNKSVRLLTAAFIDGLKFFHTLANIKIVFPESLYDFLFRHWYFANANSQFSPLLRAII